MCDGPVKAIGPTEKTRETAQEGARAHSNRLNIGWSIHDGNWVGNREFTLGPMSDQRMESWWLYSVSGIRKCEWKKREKISGCSYAWSALSCVCLAFTVPWLWLLKITRGQKRVGQRWDAQISSSPLQTLGSRIITNFELLDGWLYLISATGTGKGIRKESSILLE